MSDFVRTRGEGVYTEYRESIPTVLLYNSQGLAFYDKRLKSSGITSRECLEKIVGVHECVIVNKGKKKGFPLYQVHLLDTKITISVSPNKWEFHLQDLFLDGFVQPAGDDEYKISVLDFYTADSVNHDPIDFLEEIGKTDRRQEMREFIASLSEIRQPLREVNMERDRAMWQAYIDGQAAINSEKKDLYKILSVGKFQQEQTKSGRKFLSLTLKIQSPSLTERVINDLNSLFSNVYGGVEITEESDKVISVYFPRYETLSEEMLDGISEKCVDNCFKFKGKIVHEVRAYLKLRAAEDFNVILDEIDDALKNGFGSEVHRTSGVYDLADDDESYFIEKFIDKNGYSDSVLATRSTSLDVSFSVVTSSGDTELDRQMCKKHLRDVVMDLLGNKQIKINSAEGFATIHPHDEADYTNLVGLIRSSLSEDIEMDVPKYRPQLSIKLKSEDVDYCKSIFDELSVAFRSIKGIYLICRNKELYREFEFSYKFDEIEQLNAVKDAVSDALEKYKSLIELSYGDYPQGTTTFMISQDNSLYQNYLKSIQSTYKREDIKLINGHRYDEALEELNDAIEEKDSEWDYDLIDELKDEVRAKRKALNEIMGRGALRLGKCMSRSVDTVKFEVGGDLIEKISTDTEAPSSKFIGVGDYIQFPVAGESAELSRQQESMYRITQPNETVQIQGYYRKVASPANPLLSQFLFDPRYAGDPVQDLQELIKDIEKEGNHIENRMNKNQKMAVATAVAAPDFAIIQGPPGTGKTTVIAEIIWQEIRKNPNVKILLTSQTNLAVDNALGRLKGRPGIRPVRILPPLKSQSERLNLDEKRYLLNQIDMWEIQPKEDNLDNGVQLWIDRIKNNLSHDSKYSSALSKWNEELNSTDKMMRQQFVSSYKKHVNLVAATCSICGSSQFRDMYTTLFPDNEEAFDVVIMDEASKATPLEMAVPMVWGKKIIVIGDHKQLPPMMQEGNIVDSLKKIGRKDLADNIEQFKESQFQILFEAAATLKPNLVARLNEQYRMHEQIMNTINHFYSDEFTSGKGLDCGIKNVMDDPDYKKDGSRYHGLSLEPFIRPERHVLWVDVPDYEDKQEFGSTSRTNRAEAEAVALVIKALKKSEHFSEYFAAQSSLEDKEIGIITFYGAQAGLLEDMKRDRKLDPSIPYRINVVDKFQGMERNIVIISTVRNNKVNDFGFTIDPRRINVGFSRAKSLLIIVGSRSFLAKNPDYAKSIQSIGTNKIDLQTLRHLVNNG